MVEIPTVAAARQMAVIAMRPHGEFDHGQGANLNTAGLIEAAQLAASPTREVILLGRVSGAVTIGHPE